MLGFNDGKMRVRLDDGRVLLTSYKCFPRLRNASESQLNNWELVAGGVGIHWPDVDEDLSVVGLLRDAERVDSN